MEKQLLDSVEKTCEQIGYGRVIQAMHARWALTLIRDYDMPPEVAVAGALITDPYTLSLVDNEEIKKHLNFIGNVGK